MHASATRLDTAMQAVDVFLDIDGKCVRALIPREVFEHRLRSGPDPAAWLKSYEENAEVLNAAIKRRFAAKPQEMVVVRSSDFDFLGADTSELKE